MTQNQSNLIRGEYFLIGIFSLLIFIGIVSSTTVDETNIVGVYLEKETPIVYANVTFNQSGLINLFGGLFVNITGDTMSGNLDMGGHNISANYFFGNFSGLWNGSSNFVPYINAIANVDLGIYNLTLRGDLNVSNALHINSFLDTVGIGMKADSTIQFVVKDKIQIIAEASSPATFSMKSGDDSANVFRFDSDTDIVEFVAGSSWGIQFFGASSVQLFKVMGYQEVDTHFSLGHQAWTINQDDADMPFTDYQGTSNTCTSSSICSTNICIGTSTGCGRTIAGFLEMEVNGATKHIAYYEATPPPP